MDRLVCRQPVGPYGSSRTYFIPNSLFPNTSVSVVGHSFMCVIVINM